MPAKPAFEKADTESRKDPAVQALAVRREMWKYYPRIIYDISFAQFALMLSWTCVNSEAQQTTLRHNIGKLMAPQSPSGVIVTLSLRTFFDSLLRALNVGPGDEIVWSGVSIPQMVQIAEHHKASSRAFDIDLPTFEPDLAAAEKCFTPKTKLMVIAPVFGRPMQRLHELVAMARKHGVLCMIDAAQCFALRDELLAVGADITSFSFGSIKYATAINGSVSVLRDEGLATKVAAVEKALPVRSLGKHVGVMAKTSFIMLLDDPIGFGLLRAAASFTGVHVGELVNQMSRGFPGAELIAQIRYRPRPATIRLLQHRLAHYDKKAQRLRTISGWDFVSRLPPYVQVASAGDPTQPLRCTFWLFPMFCANPAVVSDILQAQGFDAALGTSQMRATGDATATPQCASFMSSVLYLPVYPEMDEAERSHFIKTIHDIPRKYVESPSARFHQYVASLKAKHAYRSPQVTELLKNRPQFKDGFPLILGAAAAPLLPVLLAKL